MRTLERIYYCDGEIIMVAEVEGLNYILIDLLQKNNMYISTAESCTGGLLSALITEVPGASDVFCESIITYSNEAKMRELGVHKDTLDKFGAVSYQTAKEMAEGICAHTGADLGVGITGIAGPGGGTDEKPVGTVYAGICISGKTKVIKMHHNGDRATVRESTCRAVLNEIVNLIDVYANNS